MRVGNEEITMRSEWQKAFETIKQELIGGVVEQIQVEARYEETDTQMGFGSVIVNQMIKITGVRLMKSKENPGEYFLSLPGRKGENQKYYSVCSLTPELQQRILEKFALEIFRQMADFGISLKRIDQEVLKAIAQVTIAGVTIHNVKLLQVREVYQCFFPQHSSKDGYRDIVYPIYGELRKQITERLIQEYETGR